jgi:hypothetical protein
LENGDRHEHRDSVIPTGDCAGEGSTPSQLALAWVLAQGDDVVAVPGTKHVKYLEENVGASRVELSNDDLRRIQQVFPTGAAAGERYPTGHDANAEPVGRFSAGYQGIRWLASSSLAAQTAWAVPPRGRSSTRAMRSCCTPDLASEPPRSTILRRDPLV